MQTFTIPRDIYFGANALDHLKDIKGTKAILVIGSERLIKDGTVPNSTYTIYKPKKTYHIFI